MNKSETIALPQKRAADSSLSSLAVLKRVKAPKSKSKLNKNRSRSLPSDLYIEFELKPRNQVPFLREMHNLMLWILSESEGAMPKWISVPVFYISAQKPHKQTSSNLPSRSRLPRRQRPLGRKSIPFFLSR